MFKNLLSFFTNLSFFGQKFQYGVLGWQICNFWSETQTWSLWMTEHNFEGPLGDEWAEKRKIPKMDTFLPKWPFKIGRGFKARAAQPIQTKSEYPPGGIYCVCDWVYVAKNMFELLVCGLKRCRCVWVNDRCTKLYKWMYMEVCIWSWVCVLHWYMHGGTWVKMKQALRVITPQNR